MGILRKNIGFICLFLFIFSGSIFAQKNKNQGSKNENRNFDTNESTFFADGMREFILGNSNNAMTLFEKVIDINPKNDAANYQIGLILYSQGFYNNAMNYAQKASEIDPYNVYYYELVARIYEAQMQYTEAIKVYQTMIKKIKGTDEYLFEIAILYIYNNKLEEALKTYMLIEEIIGTTDEISEQKQKIFLKLNKIDEAIKEGNKLIEKNPNDVELLSKHAFLLFSNNKFDQAEKQYLKMVQLEPDNSNGRLGLADIYRLKGDENAANEQLFIILRNPLVDIDTKIKILFTYISKPVKDEQQIEQILNTAKEVCMLHSTEAKAYSMYGDLLYNYQKPHEALNSYLKAAELDNSHYQIWQQILFIESELNQVDDLIKHSEQALELFPNQSPILYFNGFSYLQKKNYKKAIKSLERGSKLSVNDKDMYIQFQGMLGDAYNGAKMNKESDEAYESVLKIEGNNVHALNNYSYFLSLREENLQKAENMSKRLIELNPDNSTYLDTYGWVLYKMKNYSDAKRYIEKAIKNSNNGTIMEHYGDVLFRLNDVEEAVKYWKKAKELGDTSTNLDKKISTGILYE